jgi:hypothetical protein
MSKKGESWRAYAARRKGEKIRAAARARAARGYALEAGPVTVTKADGSVEVKPAYTAEQLLKVGRGRKVRT